MIYFSNSKKIFLLIICFIGLFLAFPNFSKVNIPFFPNQTINLGLDLRGGSYLLLEVETDSIKNDRSQSLLEDIRSTFRKNKIKYSGLKTNQNGIQVFIRDEDQISEARKLIQESNVSSSNLFSSNINKEFSINNNNNLF
ncbi:MAG: protein translocase subunit SecD, partial [Pseudomonadota bacterium]|nr:protein translocase subunit SecD [Pseudomonadota bacterium]